MLLTNSVQQKTNTAIHTNKSFNTPNVGQQSPFGRDKITFDPVAISIGFAQLREKLETETYQITSPLNTFVSLFRDAPLSDTLSMLKQSTNPTSKTILDSLIKVIQSDPSITLYDRVGKVETTLFGTNNQRFSTTA